MKARAKKSEEILKQPCWAIRQAEISFTYNVSVYTQAIDIRKNYLRTIIKRIQPGCYRIQLFYQSITLSQNEKIYPFIFNPDFGFLQLVETKRSQNNKKEATTETDNDHEKWNNRWVYSWTNKTIDIQIGELESKELPIILR